MIKNEFQLALLAVFLLSCGVLLVGLNKAPVPSIDGSIRAVEARNIVRTGQWLPIQFRAAPATEPALDHPPLYVWAQAVAMSLFGIGNWSANFPARMAAVLSVVLVFLVVWELGLGLIPSLAASTSLLLTRDFILNSVRGYLEPYFILFSLSSLFCLLKTQKSWWLAVVAGLSSWLVVFTKGPPGVWPVLFGFLFASLCTPKPLKNSLLYSLGFLLGAGIWILGTTAYGLWPAWEEFYLRKQLLYTIVEKRNASELTGPTYFIERLLVNYWPWLPLMLWAHYRIWFDQQSRALKVISLYPWGIIIGFSLVAWKYWYYTVPALPFFSILMAAAFNGEIVKYSQKWQLTPRKISDVLILLTGAWGLVYSVFPISLNKDRVPEVQAFSSAIVNAPYDGAVWVYKSTRDFNLLQTTGEWVFDRAVEKLDDNLDALTGRKTWLITDESVFKNCEDEICKKGTLVQASSGSALILID